ncbi:MAG: purine-nucleoside phosphorylase, partial [Hyphomonadaceae bacterium]
MSPEPEASAFAAVETAAAAVRARLGAPFPEAALVLGSGLGGFADALAQEAVIPYTEIPGFPASTVAGHAGRLVIGLAGTARIACMQGRLHLYEGHSPAAVALPVRTLRALGVRRIVLTNAAGGIREGMRAGDL